jgi:hypothetical protein
MSIHSFTSLLLPILSLPFLFQWADKCHSMLFIIENIADLKPSFIIFFFFVFYSFLAGVPITDLLIGDLKSILKGQ